jgi:hypothetical protein
MASNIVSTTIDETYPVAGVDNDSQGFRDNFQIIKDNFAAAKSEVEDLQDNVARTDTDNNHLGNKIISAELDQCTEAFTPIGIVNTDQNISFLNGHYQTFLVTDSLTLTLADWPDSGTLARITAQIEIADGSAGEFLITFRGENSGNFKSDGSVEWDSESATSVVATTASTTQPTIVEFWTADGGATIYAKHHGVFGTNN